MHAITLTSMAGYKMGHAGLDRGIADLIQKAGNGDHPDLIAELITTALKLNRDGPDRGELKLFNSALKGDALLVQSVPVLRRGSQGNHFRVSAYLSGGS